MACNCKKESQNLQIDRGSTFVRLFAWRDPAGVPMDLTGYTFEMQIRKVSDNSLVLDVDEIAGAITLNGPAGTVTIKIPDEVTATLPYSESLVYDIKATSSTGDVLPRVGALVTVNRGVTP